MSFAIPSARGLRAAPPAPPFAPAGGLVLPRPSAA